MAIKVAVAKMLVWLRISLRAVLESRWAFACVFNVIVSQPALPPLQRLLIVFWYASVF